MDEKRRYFRLKNRGEILARASTLNLEVVEISSAGVVVIKKNIDIPPKGLMEIKIHNFSMNINYELLRTEKSIMILIFNIEDEIKQLFLALKQLRDEQNKVSNT